MRGRREPAEGQAATGNPSRRKRPVVAGLGEAGEAPKQLDALAKRVWEHLAPELVRMKLLRATDAQGFARYCEAVVRYWSVTERLGTAGETYETDSAHGKMQRVNPLFIVQDRLAKRLVDLEDRFGLSPRARQQIFLSLAATTAPQLPFEKKPEETAPAPEAESPVGFLGRQLH